jgi:hypothetical protein
VPELRNVPLDYKTWYEFKRDLELKLGCGLPVEIWLRTKPKKALPWNNFDFRTSLAAIMLIREGLKNSANRLEKVK